MMNLSVFEGMPQPLFLFFIFATLLACFQFWFIFHRHKSLNRQIIKAIDAPVYLFDEQGNILKLLNTPAKEKKFISIGDLHNLNFRSLLTHKEEYLEYISVLQDVLRTKRTAQRVVQIKGDSYREYYIKVRIVYLNRKRVLVFANNITKSETQRIENEKYRFFLESILENLPIATTVKDKNDNGKYLIWNRKATEIMGVSSDRIVGKCEKDFKSFFLSNFIQETDKQVIEKGRAQSYIKYFTNPYGKEYILSFNKALVTYNNGEERWMVSSALDITELLTAKEKAEEANRLKTAFLNNISHEIRTPLNAIVGFSSMLTEFNTNSECKEYVQIIKRNNELLLQLINDILDVSKIETDLSMFIEGEMDVNKTFCNMQVIAQTKISPQVQVLFSPESERCVIYTIPARVKQVINNYLSNAIKYTEQGYIKIGYNLLPEKKIRFFVRDTGCGIPADKQDEIFGYFTKLNDFKQGAGLGLSICKIIAEKIGGKVGVISEPGKGSEFRLEIPFIQINEG